MSSPTKTATRELSSLAATGKSHPRPDVPQLDLGAMNGPKTLRTDTAIKNVQQEAANGNATHVGRVGNNDYYLTPSNTKEGATRMTGYHRSGGSPTDGPTTFPVHGSHMPPSIAAELGSEKAGRVTDDPNTPRAHKAIPPTS